MNKKGFTLIELIAVITILGIITVIAVPSVLGIQRLINEDLLDSKLNIIQKSAIMYGQDNKKEVVTSTKKYQTYSCKSIKVKDLVPNYLDYDTESNCNGNCVINPNKEDEYLDNMEIIIYYKNKRINAVVDNENKLTCS